MDRLIRDQSVGAVCARTHPLGKGPVVWYQVFEYAIGHWFQKVYIRMPYTSISPLLKLKKSNSVMILLHNN